MKAIILLLIGASVVAVSHQNGRQYQYRGAKLNFPWNRDDLDEEAVQKVVFELFTRENLEEPEIVHLESKEAIRNFNPSRPTKIIVHGWHAKVALPGEIRKAFLDVMDANVFFVYWGAMDTWVYPLVVEKLHPVARRVAALVDFLRDSFGVLPEDLHLVGHSLGAHVPGLASLYIKSGTLGRISGLDPAGPLIRNNPKYRLDKSHANFVDVIHTCGNLAGWRQALGHVDFYPNGGKCIQPGCLLLDLTKFSCSHNRAYDLFTESILRNDSMVAVPSKPFRSWPCKEVDEDGEKVVMGLGTPVSARGVYCLSTRSSSPFGYGVNMTMNSVSGSEREPSRREANIMLSKFMNMD